MWGLAGIGHFKKATQGATPVYAVFCGTKLNKLNEGAPSITVTLLIFTKTILIGKEDGKKMTLPNLLITQSGDLRTQYKALLPDERDMLVIKHLQEKENEKVPKRASHTTVAKAVYSQMQLVSATVYVCITSLTCF